MNDITELRGHLFDTLKALKDGSMEIDRAKAVSQIADTIIDTAKVEVDFILLHESPQWLNGAREYIEAWLPSHLGLNINTSKTILQPINRGVDFVGQVIKPWQRTTRRRTFNEALRRVATMDRAELFETANSYFGLLGQATHSHGDRARLANVVRDRGCAVNGRITKAYRLSTAKAVAP